MTVLASAAILVTLLAHYANHILVNPANFSGRAVNVVRSGAVGSLITDSITNRLVQEVGGAAGLRPAIEAAVSESLSNPQVDGEIRAAAASLQNQLVSGTAGTLTLALPDAGSAIASSLASSNSELAAVVAHVGTITVVDVPIPAGGAKAIRDLATVGRRSSLLVILSAALVLLALILSPDRRRTLRGLGVGAVVTGLLAVALYLVGRRLVVDQFSTADAQTAARAAWTVYFGGVRTSGFVMAVVGALIAILSTLALAGTRGRPVRPSPHTPGIVR